MKDQTAFPTRFARHQDELEWLFMELYHNRGNMFGMTIKFAFSELDFASVLLRSLPCAAFSALFGCQLRILGFQLFRAWQLGKVVCLEIGCCRPVRCQLCTMLLLKGC